MTVSAPLVAVPPAEVAVVLRPVAAVAVITPLARTIAETATTTAETAVIVLAAQKTGKFCHRYRCVTSFAYILIHRDRDTKEDREETRENGTNGEDRKGEFSLLAHSNFDNH